MARLTFHQIRQSLRDLTILRVTLLKIGLFCFWPALYLMAAVYRRIWIPSCQIIVVVGSFGKTTTSQAIAHTLGCGAWSQIEWNNRPGAALRMLRLRRHHRFSVLELGIDGPGQMSGVARMIRPDVVVVTSIGSEHLKQFKSLEVTRAEKSRILEGMTNEGLVILNGDDPNVFWMSKQTKGQIVTCGFSKLNQIRAEDVEFGFPPTMSLRVIEDRGKFELKTRLTGHSMVFSLLAAYAVAKSAGIDTGETVQRLAELQPGERRMEVQPLLHGAWALVDDCKSLPETIDSALRTLAEIPAVRTIVVMGEVGGLMGKPRDIDASCFQYGVKLGKAADLLLLLTRDPQQKSAIKKGAVESGLSLENLSDEESLTEAIAYLRRILQPGDLVLFKGRFSERLVRIVFALQGRDVSCWVTTCEPRLLSCHRCPNLSRS